MNRLAIEKLVTKMNMTELAHNCMFVKDGLAHYRDYDGVSELRELIKALGKAHGVNLPKDNDVLEEQLLDDLQYGLHSKEGLFAFIYQNMWAMANLREALKKYEDTGLTPEQLKEIDKLYQEKCEELAKYQDAKIEGRVVILPCKIGDTIFKVDIDPFILDADIESHIVDNFVICDDGEVLINYDGYDGTICTANNLINKTPYLDYYLCFFTRKEAESALERIKENEQ